MSVTVHLAIDETSRDALCGGATRRDAGGHGERAYLCERCAALSRQLSQRDERPRCAHGVLLYGRRCLRCDGPPGL